MTGPGKRQAAFNALEKQCQFGGYGGWNAPLWLCGTEEHGNDDEGPYDDAWLIREAEKMPASGLEGVMNFS